MTYTNTETNAIVSYFIAGKDRNWLVEPLLAALRKYEKEYAENRVRMGKKISELNQKLKEGKIKP